MKTISMEPLNVNGQRAIRIKGKRLRQFTAKAILVDCDGDAEWFPWDTVRFNDDGTVDIQEWIIKKKFPKV